MTLASSSSDAPGNLFVQGVFFVSSSFFKLILLSCFSPIAKYSIIIL